MVDTIVRIMALAKIVVLDGLRRNAVSGLVLLTIIAEAGCLFYMNFIGRDIGRASSDFILSVGWLSGMIFIFFHAVQRVSWHDEKGTVFFMLARPVSRSEYVLGIFTGLLSLLLILNVVVSTFGWLCLLFVRNSVSAIYFPEFSTSAYLLAWGGLFFLELMLLSVIMFFSGVIRGGFSVMLLSLSYYVICSGLPVVRESVANGVSASGPLSPGLLKIMTFIFPSFEHLDFKNFIVHAAKLPDLDFVMLNFSLSVFYVFVVMWMACFVYSRRDLQ